MRDENGFKMHVQSESHVRRMLLVGEDPKKFINDYSNQFQRDFLQLLRTSHGEKKIHLNHFYQEYISNKEHIHMNATKWPSLTEFAKFLGREGICRVEEEERGLFVSWIDNSPEALRRQDAIRKKERQDKGDEEREQMLIRQQVARAKAEAGDREEELSDGERELKREGDEKIKLSFGAKPLATRVEASPADTPTPKLESAPPGKNTKQEETAEKASEPVQQIASEPALPAKVTMKMGFSSKPKNVFAAAKKNALGGKKAAVIEQPKKMSEAERIMKEEMAKKRGPPGFDGPAQKKQRL
jgi:DNA/RNA-binding protein KIN17